MEKQDEEKIWNIEWDDYKEDLEKKFFHRSDYFSRNTELSIEFWDFFEKYKLFRKRKLENTKCQEIKHTSEQEQTHPQLLDLPKSFDERYLLNFSIIFEKNKTVRGKRRDQVLPQHLIQEFKRVIHLYENFCQKKNYQKILKIKTERETLPIRKYKEQILETIRSNKSNITMIAGDTGCGKSTQVVQYLLESGFEGIACTQPRRIAAISLSRRVAYETLNEYGTKIGYQIRFESHRNHETKAVFLTEGVLLRQLAVDKLLRQYKILIIDEVHERHIHTDFLLGVLKHHVLAQRPDLHLILMSATINTALFAEYFNQPPLITVPGRVFPIAVEYHPLQTSDEDENNNQKNNNNNNNNDNDNNSKKSNNKENNKKQRVQKNRIQPGPYLRVMERIDQQIPIDERGDLLIFVSGLEEIITLAEEMKHYANYTK
jgi:HrpA-like RNA helicase